MEPLGCCATAVVANPSAAIIPKAAIYKPFIFIPLVELITGRPRHARTRAIRMMRTDWAKVKAAVAYGWSRANNIGDPDRPYKALVFAPSVLSDLGNEDRADEPLHEVIGIRTFDELAKMHSGGNAPRRMLIIDAQAFAVSLTDIEESVLGVSKEKFVEEMRMFCVEIFGSAKPLRWNV